MRKVTNGDLSHLRLVAETTNPPRFRVFHEETTFFGYSEEEDLLIFKTSDDHVFTIARGLLEELLIL